jgi:erythromycin esterase-like protein
VGQLVREHWRERAVLVGFTTYTGTVTAADDWDAPARRKVVNRGMPGSYEALFHDVGLPDFYLRLRDGGAAADALRAPRLERAIGVIYRPDTERVSHYFRARLADQFDAVIHVDDTSAVQPLERVGVASSTEPPETFPSGI